MATVRDGNRSILLVVDVQKGVVTSAHDRDKVIANIREVLRKAREKNVPIVWVQHSDDELEHGSDAWEIVPELTIENGEYSIDKRHNSAFEDTDLEKVLGSLGATRIVLVGAATNWCVRATAYGALDRGYDVSLVSDAHTTGSIRLKDGRTIEARDIIAELNIAMSWLSYPGRENEAVETRDFDFS